MRFYLASAFDLRERVAAVFDTLIAEGHQVPIRWWDHTAEAHELKAAPGTDEDFYARPSVQMTAARDLGGVATCDAFILIAAEDRARKFNGANVELGYALACGKPCYALGKLERSALYAHVRRRASIGDILDDLRFQGLRR